MVEDIGKMGDRSRSWKEQERSTEDQETGEKHGAEGSGELGLPLEESPRVQGSKRLVGASGDDFS